MMMMLTTAASPVSPPQMEAEANATSRTALPTLASAPQSSTSVAPVPHTPKTMRPTVYVRMRDLQGSVAIELEPQWQHPHDLVVRFHELAFAKSYTAYVDQACLLCVRAVPTTGAVQECEVTQLKDLKDQEVLLYRPCDELRSLVENGCITPILCARTRSPMLLSSSPSSSPCLKRKGRCPPLTASTESHQEYSDVLSKMDVSPREKEMIADLLNEGNEQVVDALEQFSITRNPAMIRRVLRGPRQLMMSTNPLNPLDSLSYNFATLDVHSSPVTVYPEHAVENPFVAAANAVAAPGSSTAATSPMSSCISEAGTPTPTATQDDPFLMRPSLGAASAPPSARPSLTLDDTEDAIASIPSPPAALMMSLHRIQESKNADSRMSLSIEDLDAGYDDSVPPFMSIAQHLEGVPVLSNFDQKYTVSRVLGSGKCSVVKECTHIATGQRYAVKIIDKMAMVEVRFLKRELEIMSSLHHEGIVQLVELYESHQELCLVLELCKQELFEYIDREGPLDEKTAQQLIHNLVSTVSYLHQESIVHRDIKPENILIYGDNVSAIKLSDFGIARRLEGDQHAAHTPHDSTTNAPLCDAPPLDLNAVRNRMARAHTKCGTRDYVAPEVMSGKGYGTEADMWSVGVVTYVLLSGCAPVMLPGADGERRPAFLEDCWHDISQDAKQFIEALLVRNPEQRITEPNALLHPWLANVNH